MHDFFSVAVQVVVPNELALPMEKERFNFDSFNLRGHCEIEDWVSKMSSTLLGFRLFFSLEI